jgi:predicted DNA-binding transcriptional regulator AlpA
MATEQQGSRTRRGTGPDLPLDAIWLDAEGIGVMLSCPARKVREQIACRPDFPKPARVGAAGRSGHQRWNAAEVNAWVQAQRALAS